MKAFKVRIPERRWTIDKNYIKPIRGNHRFQTLLESLQMVFRPREFNIHTAEIHFAGDNFQTLVSGRLYFVQQGAISE